MLSRRVGVYLASFVSVALLLASQGKSQQQISDFDRRRAQDILQVVAKEVRNNYYDITFLGLDWDAKVAEVKEKIAKTTSAHMAMSHIAAMLDTLNDSHFVLSASRTHHSIRLRMAISADRRALLCNSGASEE